MRQVWLAPIRYRCQVRGIGFHQQAIGRNLSRHIAQGISIAKGDYAGQGNIETQVQGRLGHIPILSEAMQYTRLGQVGLAQQRQGIGACAAGMNDDGLAGHVRRLQVQPKRLLLPLGSFRFVVVIQASLTNGNHVRVFKFAQQPVQGWCGPGLQIKGVHADRTIDVDITLGQVLDRLRVLGTHADTEKMPDATRPRSIEGDIQRTGVLREIETIQVAMGIYKHRYRDNSMDKRKISAAQPGPTRTPARLQATARD
ncbi:hypothetical protein D3C76_936930 [compost metagenome]